MSKLGKFIAGAITGAAAAGVAYAAYKNKDKIMDTINDLTEPKEYDDDDDIFEDDEIIDVPEDEETEKAETELIDTTGDGKVDTIAEDTTEDGQYDTILVDEDGDGKVDTVILDTDGDGVVDSYKPVEEVQ